MPGVSYPLQIKTRSFACNPGYSPKARRMCPERPRLMFDILYWCLSPGFIIGHTPRKHHPAAFGRLQPPASSHIFILDYFTVFSASLQVFQRFFWLQKHFQHFAQKINLFLCLLCNFYPLLHFLLSIKSCYFHCFFAIFSL